MYLLLIYYFRVQTYDPEDLVMMPETAGVSARNFLILCDTNGGVSYNYSLFGLHPLSGVLK